MNPQLITNENITEGKNPHIKFSKSGGFILATPKQEENDAEPLQHFFPERSYVPLLEILSTVNRSTELRAISAWLKERARMKPPSSVKTIFISEQRKPLHRSTVNLLLRTYSAAASLPLLAHPHMLRHACGFALADQGADTRLIQDYLGHRNIQHTVKYTATNRARFEKLWR